MLLGVMGWAIVGLLVGFIVSKVVDLHGDDPRFGMALTVVGGVVGGWLYSWFSGSPVTYFNLWSLGIAFVGALIVGALGQALRARTPHQPHSIRRSY